MVKLENGVVNKEDMDGDCQELLSPPQPSSPTNSISHSASKVTNGVASSNGNDDDDREEQEPLLQKAVKNKPETLTTTPKTTAKVEGQNRLQNGDLTIPIFVTSDRLSVDTGKAHLSLTQSLRASSYLSLKPNRESIHIIQDFLSK